MTQSIASLSQRNFPLFPRPTNAFSSYFYRFPVVKDHHQVAETLVEQTGTPKFSFSNNFRFQNSQDRQDSKEYT
ncbi:hypothetical protein RF55_24851, partial [Lasius niger]